MPKSEKKRHINDFKPFSSSGLEFSYRQAYPDKNGVAVQQMAQRSPWVEDSDPETE